METFEQLKRLFAQIVAEHPSQARVDVLGPPIEKWAAREPDNPNALDWLAWLNEQRELLRKADPRTYAGRKLPESLTRLLQG